MEYDIVIIGSGPAGLSAAVYAGRAMLRCIVIEKEYAGSGRIANAHRVDNYLGFNGISGFDMGESFRAHAAGLGTDFLEAEVKALKPGKPYHEVTLSGDKGTLLSRTVIITSGTTHRKLDVPGEAELAGAGVSYCAVCDGIYFKGKTVAVVGGGDTAFNDALSLSKICEKVYIIGRGQVSRASKVLRDNAENTQNIEIMTNTVVTGIKGITGVESVLLRNTATGDNTELQASGVFVAIGMVPNSAWIGNTVKRDSEGYILADETGQSSTPGIFAAGDIRTKKLRQVSTAVADGANCVYSAEQYLKEHKYER